MEPITTEINFTQYTAAANDYNAPDGDMAALFNLIPEDGTLKPILNLPKSSNSKTIKRLSTFTNLTTKHYTSSLKPTTTIQRRSSHIMNNHSLP